MGHMAVMILQATDVRFHQGPYTAPLSCPKSVFAVEMLRLADSGRSTLAGFVNLSDCFG